jgi:hypothetical protein
LFCSKYVWLKKEIWIYNLKFLFCTVHKT